MKHRKTAQVQKPLLARDDGSNKVPGGWLKQFWEERVHNSAVLFGLVPVGTAVGSWISELVALPQLRKLAVGEIPWTPLNKPLAECTVVLVSTGGVHLHHDRPFKVDGDPT